MKASLRRNITWSIVTGILGVGCILGYTMYQRERSKGENLETQLAQLSKKERQSFIVQRISSQMEEIAKEQQYISDQQRKEAIEQKNIANDMRQKAELEQHKAQEAERAARLSESKAIEASGIAETQRALAVQRLLDAEYSRRVADTLSFLALARNLGSRATIQHNTGNTELAALLAYASYTYTNRYLGDVYNPAIYESLALTSKNNVQWSVGRGTIIQTKKVPTTENTIIAITNYGEVTYNEIKNGRQQTRTLFSDNKYDLRDVIFIGSNYYIVSHTGHLLKGKGNNVQEVLVDGAYHPLRIFQKKQDQIIVVAEKSIHLLDASTLRPIKMLRLDFEAKTAGEDPTHIFLFDNKGGMYIVDTQLDKITKSKLPFSQIVTAYNYDTSTGAKAYGTIDGSIYYFEPSGKMHRLVGHRSRVSRLEFENDLLYSTSYDGTVRFWKTNADKIDPITVMNSNQWIVTFTIASDRKHVWTGDQHGNINYTDISAEMMAEKVRANLKRKFTKDEWDLYIGSNFADMPYESYLNNGL